MNNVMKSLLLIESFDLNHLVEEYREFFLAILPSVFIFAVIVEYFDRLEPFSLLRRALISIMILTCVTSFYHSSIEASLDTADEILKNQKQSNVLLMDMLDGIDHIGRIEKDKKAKEFIRTRSDLGNNFISKASSL